MGALERLEQLAERHDVLEAGALPAGEGQTVRELVEPEIGEQYEGDCEEAGDEHELLGIAEAVHEPDARRQEPRHGDSPPRHIGDPEPVLP